MKKKQLEQEQKNWEAEMAFKEKQLAEEKRQFDEQMALKKPKSSGGGSSKKTSVQKDDLQDCDPSQC